MDWITSPWELWTVKPLNRLLLHIQTIGVLLPLKTVFYTISLLSCDCHLPFLTAWTWGGAEPQSLKERLCGLSGIFTILDEKRPVRPVHHMRVCLCVCVYQFLWVFVCVPSLLGLGGDQQPQRASYAEGLADHGFHFGKGSEEQQVLVDGMDLPAHLQASHLDRETDRHETKCCLCWFSFQVVLGMAPSETSTVCCISLRKSTIHVFTTPHKSVCYPESNACSVYVPPRSVTENKPKHNRKKSLLSVFTACSVLSCIFQHINRL